MRHGLLVAGWALNVLLTIPFQPQTVLLAQERSGSGPRSQPPASLDRSIKRAFVPLGMNVPGVLYEPLTLGEKAASASLSCMHND
jgi:hypothetical protein